MFWTQNVQIGFLRAIAHTAVLLITPVLTVHESVALPDDFHALGGVTLAEEEVTAVRQGRGAVQK